MKDHALKKFDDDLKNLKLKLFEMAARTEECVLKVTQALKGFDVRQAQAVIANDMVIDALENQIDEKAIE